MKRDYRNKTASEQYYALLEDFSRFPFSFTYGQKNYHGFSEEDFFVQSHTVTEKNGKETHSIAFSLAEELSVTLVLSHYASYGVTEWTVWFENHSDHDSAILEDPRTELTLSGARPMLKGILGDHVNQYSPYSIELSDNFVEFSSDRGRATHKNFPYFNLEHGEGGTMLAIGWAGTWSARFCSDGEKTIWTARSVNGFRSYLKAGEKIRTALFVTAPYTVRSERYATNFWRSWFVEHNLPRADATGAMLEPFSTCCLASDTGLPNSDGSISERYDTWKPSLDKMIAEDVKVDFRWFDAGWYVCPDGSSAEPFVKGHDWWHTIGTWELDPRKWPDKTFLESTDYARANGMKTLVWFEPERVTDPENLAKNYGYNLEWAIQMEGERTVSNNIGDPECLAWTTERICKMLRENKVEMYREDNNCDAAKLWKHLDSLEGEGRRGITECKFIYGHYKMWDDIIACTLSYGGCGFVDSCAGGGGRNDLESMRRGVPLLRSDSDRTTTALRLSMTTAFNKWIPFCGANTKEKVSELALTGVSDPYVWRASYLPSLNVDSQFVQDPDQDFGMLRFGLKEWKTVAPYMLKDFYTLTPWHKEKDVTDFTAFAYVDPETERGVLLAFRQERCKRDTLHLRLPFVEGGEQWSLTDADSQQTIQLEAQDLSLTFADVRTARLLYLKKI